ncbi:hypothetical protein LGT39_06035 [Demequina sp. TTPB684]|uniref:hypothetical protein n=1 Tax=unclassified Demequina TaxID=2620311 RepID=UPI001CF2B11A|nr:MULTISPECIES: hypothetical protein [unclassified Demequina]MCB2412407.1 hypothetical protein [Demequina sp. TTPB684]UPU89509.1 hypothetical protein LGT36_006160 [Demequina sp. TMPB413]
MSTRSNTGARWTLAYLTVAVALVLAFTGNVQAKAVTYSCYAYGWPHESHVVYYEGVNSTWSGYFDTARSRWNNAGVGANIQLTTLPTSTKPYVTAGRYSSSWYGYYTRYSNRYRIQVNARVLDENTSSTAQLATWAKGTTTHEFGHARMLKDNPLTSNPNGSLMNYSRNRDTVVSPTSYDKAYTIACFD